MDGTSRTPTPSYDRFRIVRLCRRMGIPFHELVNGRLPMIERNKKGVKTKKTRNEP